MTLRALAEHPCSVHNHTQTTRAILCTYAHASRTSPKPHPCKAPATPAVLLTGLLALDAHHIACLGVSTLGWHTEEVLQGTVIVLELLVAADNTVDQGQVHVQAVSGGLLSLVLDRGLGGGLRGGREGCREYSRRRRGQIDLRDNKKCVCGYESGMQGGRQWAVQRRVRSVLLVGVLTILVCCSAACACFTCRASLAHAATAGRKIQELCVVYELCARAACFKQ